MRPEQLRIFNTVWDDEKILDYPIKENGTINSVKVNPTSLKFYPKLKEYLYTRFSDIEETDSPSEIVYRICHNINIRPKCIVCGKNLQFRTFKLGYANMFCSQECNNTPEGKAANVQAYKNAVMEKYGVDNTYKLKEVQEKMKHTTIERYGVEHHTQSKEYKDKMLEKYGATCNFKRKEVIAKKEETNIKRYGGISPFSSKEILDKIDYKAIAKKSIETKYENHTFNKSSSEEKVYELLIELGFSKTIRQHKTKEYPHYCDFFIPSKNLYIEFQGSQYHHGKPFNPLDENDIKELNYLKELDEKFKSMRPSETNQYGNMIGRWIDKDVAKRKKVHESTIKFIELFIVPDKETLAKIVELSSKYRCLAYYKNYDGNIVLEDTLNKSIILID